jgi:uncharacterized membrane protein HdeD (DUF308 family)
MMNISVKGGLHIVANKNFSMSSTAKAILAIIAGILCIFYFAAAQWIIGIFLIVWGVLALIDR